ncbi:MAG: S41 family peptidase [Planctomycetota bacterium]|nr:S41 family peptidase [Planctomycetota bacterium]
MPAKRVIAPALVVALFGALLVQLPLAIAERTSIYEWYNTIQDVRHVLVEDFVRPPDEEAMQRAMIGAMIETLDDPYTQYVPPDDTDEFNKQLRGTYAGIGAEVNFADGHLVIITPMDDSPALRAGIMAGDVVLEIDGESTFEEKPANYRRKLNECVEKLTGEIGTEVDLTVRHLDDTEETITVIRDRIVTRTVRGLRRVGEAWSHCLDGELGLSYIRITQFNDATVDELKAVLDHLQGGGLNGLVLDLRDNPGGGLPTAVTMADLFLEEGAIVSVRPREGEEVTYRAEAEGTLPDFPMIVLVNGQSASASEIVSGALQENDRAKVLGTRTFGKASVQEVRTLPYNEGTLKFTTAHYYLPSGRNLNRTPDSSVAWGVDPDPGFVVPISDEDYLEMFRARREYGVIREPEEPADLCTGADWIREHLLDEQLAAAVEALQSRLRGAAWPEPGEAEAGQIAFDQELARAMDRRTRLIDQLAALEDRIDTLQQLGEEAGREPLLPPEVDLVDGTITLHDRHGNLVGTYHIDGGAVNLALETLALTPVGEEVMSDER